MEIVNVATVDESMIQDMDETMTDKPMDLSVEQRQKLEQSLLREVEASDNAKGDLPRRWQRALDMYHLKEGTCRMQAVENMPSYEIALAAPMIDRCVDAVIGSLTALYPYVQCIDPGDDGQDPTNDEDCEKLLHAMARNGGFIANATKAVLYAALTNLGITRISPDDKRGCRMEWVDPQNIIVYPAEFGKFSEAKTIGHHYTMLLYRVKERQASGEFYDVSLLGDTGERDNELKRRQFDKTQQTEAVRTDDSPVKLAYVIHECDLVKEGEYKRYECIFATDQGKLLSCKPYLYSQPNYFDWRFDDPEGEIYTGGSLMQMLQGLQLAYSDLFTVFIQGTFACAFPTIYESGGAGPLKVSSYGAATRIQTPVPINVQVVQGKMEAQQIPTILEGLQERASAISGISQLGQSANLPSGTTATAAAGFLQAQQEAKNRYAQSVAPTIGRMWEFMYELYQKHKPTIDQALGTKATPFDPVKQYSFEVTNESGASNTAMLIQKLTMLNQMAANPQSEFDTNKVTDKIVQLLDFPFPAAALKKDGPSAEQMKAVIMGLMIGELSPPEAAQALGITPQMLQQFAMTHQGLHGQVNNQPANGDSGMGVPPEGPTGPTQGGPIGTGVPPM